MMENHQKEIFSFIRNIYNNQEGFIPLHEPRFNGNERKYVLDCIDSTYVSSVGKYVDDFEKKLAEYTGASYAIAVSNGTAALHIALLAAGVGPNDFVITQPLTFIATCNAISYLGAEPLFVDIDSDTLSLSPDKLNEFLKKETVNTDKGLIHKTSGRKISACVPMHTFGLPGRIDEIAELCVKHGVPLIEDAAESIGSKYKGIHTGCFGLMGTLSFNGNKIITAGGGGAVITNDRSLAISIKHLTTQAKVPHSWEFVHDNIGFNYRMPNLNAALVLAQLECLDGFLQKKRALALSYQEFFSNTDIQFVSEINDARSNYWLNTVLLPNKQRRDAFLKESNSKKIMTRPAWALMPSLDMFRKCLSYDISNSLALEQRIVNIPSSVPLP